MNSEFVISMAERAVYVTLLISGPLLALALLVGLIVSVFQATTQIQEQTLLSTMVPAFVISELKTAFQMGFMIFIPFLIIDMVVASVLMSMGMMMLPPVMISLPFKILLFVLVDGCMGPTFSEINKEALTPLMNNKITLDEAYTKAEAPIKTFMSKHTRQKDLALFMNYAKMETPESINDIPAANVSASVRLLLLLTVFSIAPGILILMTCFTRVVIVLSFVRTSLATQSMPPNQVLIGLALFLTFFIR
ncbi:flagellar biosynthetic protein FliP [Bacillus licheniformis]|nr:flagellar biosynthetic protein FliP [Bacillus licheniformis]